MRRMRRLARHARAASALWQGTDQAAEDPCSRAAPQQWKIAAVAPAGVRRQPRRGVSGDLGHEHRRDSAKSYSPDVCAQALQAIQSGSWSFLSVLVGRFLGAVVNASYCRRSPTMGSLFVSLLRLGLRVHRRSPRSGPMETTPMCTAPEPPSLAHPRTARWYRPFWSDDQPRAARDAAAMLRALGQRSVSNATRPCRDSEWPCAGPLPFGLIISD